MSWHMHAYSRAAYAPFLGKATEVRTYSMLIAGDSNGRVYPEKLFKVVGTYAAYVLADSAFARLDHGSQECMLHQLMMLAYGMLLLVLT